MPPPSPQDPAAAKVAFVEVQSAGREVEEHRLMWRALWADFFASEAARAVARGEAADRDHSLGIVALMGAVNELLAHWSRQAPRPSVAPAALAGELTQAGPRGARRTRGSADVTSHWRRLLQRLNDPEESVDPVLAARAAADIVRDRRPPPADPVEAVMSTAATMFATAVTAAQARAALARARTGRRTP